MTDQLVLIGGGGHCKSCIEVLITTGYKVYGILEKNTAIRNILDIPVVGDDDNLGALAARDFNFLITIGQLRNVSPRVSVYEKIKSLGGKLATVMAASAQVSRYAKTGEGTIVMQQAIINAEAVVGKNCIINNKSLVEHDCRVGDHVHISTGAILNGGCVVGDRVFIGSSSVLAQGIQIASDVVIGAGAVVISNIEQAGVYAGNPARKINS
jgi:sugar O-acyltransferase (sialic acid O-acetyltransferase NeuD family)